MQKVIEAIKVAVKEAEAIKAEVKTVHHQAVLCHLAEALLRANDHIKQEAEAAKAATAESKK